MVDMMGAYYEAVKRRNENQAKELEEAIRTAIPYYDVEYAWDWSMDKLIKKILEICHGKVR